MDRAAYLRDLAQFLTVDLGVARAAHRAYVERAMNERQMRALMEAYPGRPAPRTSIRKNGCGRWRLTTQLPGVPADE